MPNKVPALQIYGDLNKTGEGICDKMNGVGAHEVIIETPDHHLSLSTMPQKAVEDVLWAAFLRNADLKKDQRFKYCLVFKNEGEVAGASLEHTHTQLIALPIVPKLVKEELDSARQHFEFKERCIFCDVINQEIADGKRVIYENAKYVALAPFAPRAPFETWILPKHHDSMFRPPDKNFSELAEIFQRILRQMDRILDTPPYNFVIHTSPLLSRTTFYNNQLVDWNNFDIYQVMSLYHSQLLGSDDLRELARTNPWTNIWVINKKTGNKLFNNECLSDEQSFLMSCTITYDNIGESPDCPSDDIIEDDDMLDGWLIVQRRKREDERKKSEAENAITKNPRIQNAEEIFVVAETLEDAQKVDALNDMRGQIIKRQRMALIKEKGQVRQDEFQDVRQELQTQLNRMYSDKMRG